MPIKTQELCEKCKYAFGDYCIGGGCTVCLMNTNDKNRCKCLTIKKGQDCPYFTPNAAILKLLEHLEHDPTQPILD